MIALLSLLACQNGTGATPGVAAPGPAPSPTAAPAYGPGAEAVVAYWKGGSVAYKDAQETMKLQVLQMENEYLTQRYEAELSALDQKVSEAILTAEAEEQKLGGVEALLKREIEDKVGAPSELEISEAYQVLQRKFRGRPLEEVRSDVEKAVKQRKQGELYGTYIQSLRTKYGVVVQLPFPELPRFPVAADDDPAMGPEAAPVTIIQFADYQCGYCGKAQATIDQLMKDYDGKIRFVFRDFPLNFHEQATPAATAANCAGKQDKFWQVHGAIMQDQRALSEADLEKLAVNAQVDLSKWKECRADPSVTEEVMKDLADGSAVGVTGTPAFFINGIFLNGAQPYEKFKAILDRELAPKAG